VRIGSRCFVGTRVIILPGSVVGDRSVVGAGALVNKAFPEPGAVLGGVPARVIGAADPQWAYFTRATGQVG
jgi:acetyltransferase-like isoleucine patch superfamily enzyme